MTITRLRPKWSDEQLKEIYSTPHNHSIYGHGHWLRVEVAKPLAKWACSAHNLKSVGDLSCGNGAIAKSLGFNPSRTILGDFADGYKISGPIELTIDQINPVDLYVCTETLEHLDDPLSILKKIRNKARVLLLGTPVDNWDDSNGEHYWSWDVAGVESLMREAEWTPQVYASLDSRYLNEPYNYAFWVAK